MTLDAAPVLTSDTAALFGESLSVDAAPADAAPADARPGDGSVEPDAFVPPPGGEPCTSADQCPFGDCIDGACNNERPNRCIENGDADCPEGETCGGFDENYYCVRPCEVTGDCPVRTRPCSTNFDCAAGSSCHAGRCTNNCETDRNCGEAGFCYDGACRPYPQDLWTGAAPRPLGRPGELVAGVATVPLDYPVGVELGGNSVSSPGFESYLTFVKPDILAAALVAENEQLKWADTAQRGYMMVELTPARATTEYRFMAGIKQRSTRLAGTKRITTGKGSAKLSV
jgi:hypothetical protein